MTSVDTASAVVVHRKAVMHKTQRRYTPNPTDHVQEG